MSKGEWHPACFPALRTDVGCSAVDPKKFESLDRRSTILLTASRSATEDVEKGDIIANEERECRPDAIASPLPLT